MAISNGRVTSIQTEPAAVYLTSVEIIDLGPFHKFRIDLGLINLIVGDNGTGKTTLHDCIEMFFEAGADRSLLRQGCMYGEARLTLSNGYAAVSSLEVNEEKGGVDYTLKIFNPDGGEVKKPATVIKQWLMRGSFNPVKFLNLDDREMADYLLKYLYISFMGEQINGALNTPLGTIPLEPVTQRRTDEVIDLAKFEAIREEIFSARTAINQDIRDLEGTIRDFRESMLPEQGIDWAKRRDELQREVSALDADIAAGESNVKLEAEQARTKAKTETLEFLAEKTPEVEEYVTCSRSYAELVKSYVSSSDDSSATQSINDSCDWLWENRDPYISAVKAIVARRLELGRQLSAIDQAEREAIAQLRDEMSGRRAEKAELLGTARANADRQRESIGVQNAIVDREQKLKGKRTRADQFTAILESLDRLKNEKLKQLPIEDFDLKYDKHGRPVIHIGGLPLYRINKQKQLFVAIQCIREAQKANTNEEQLPMILCESAEISETYLAALEDACRDAGVQLIVTRPEKDAPLSIETSVEAAAESRRKRERDRELAGGVS